MKRTQSFAMSCIAVLAVATALPAVAVTPLLNLRAAVQNRGRAEYYGIKPAEPVPLSIGETVRVELVGSAANGAQVPVNASFFQVTNRSSITLGRSGANWVEVKGVNNYGNGLGALGYKVNDGRYSMKGALSEGRITFQMAGGNAPVAGPGPNGDSRLEAARTVSSRLYRTLIGEDSSSSRVESGAATISRGGYSAIQQLALELSREADARRFFAGQSPTHVMGEIYRGLLGRSGSDRDLEAQDSGFRGSVDGLRRHGLTTAVQAVVTSQEFQSVNQLQASGLL